MKSYALFKEYIWLVNTINFAGKITLEDINRKWVETDMSEGLPIVRSTFNRHKDANYFIILLCDKRIPSGFKVLYRANIVFSIIGYTADLFRKQLYNLPFICQHHLANLT